MSLLTLSFGCGLLILLILLFRRTLTRRLPKRVITVLWAVCALRLIIPFSLELPVLALNETVAAGESAAITCPANFADDISPVIAYESDVTPEVSESGLGNTTGAAAAQSRKARKFPVKAFLFGIWLLGASAMLVFFGLDLVRSIKRVGMGAKPENPYVREWICHHGTLRRIRIKVCDNIGSPLTYGVFRPVIVITKAADSSPKETLNYILTHEYMHIRHFDSALKLVLALALCLHWFNPLVWVMFKAAAKDIELACDEDVIRALGNSERADYAKTLILTGAGASSLLLSDFKTSTIEERIVAIMKYKKLSALSVAIAAAIAVTTALCAFTKPVAKEQEEIVRTTVRQEPNVTCKETYVKDSDDHMRRWCGYIMANDHYVVQHDDEKSGKYVFREDFANLNSDDYTKLVPDESGVCYLDITEAKQFTYTGRVIITDKGGKPFKAVYNECDSVSFYFLENNSLTEDDKDIFGFVVNGEDVKRTECDSGNYIGLAKLFDSDTDFYIFLESDVPAYVNCVSVSLAQGSFHGGLENGKYYIDGNQHTVNGDENVDYILKKYQLETAYNIQLGNSVSLQTSDKLLSGLKAGQKVHVVTDIDLENTVIPEKYKWTNPETGITYTDESGYDVPRWGLTLLKKSDDGSLYEWVSSTSKRNLDVNVTFEIPEDGDYVVRLMNESSGTLLKIISTEVEIINITK